MAPSQASLARGRAWRLGHPLPHMAGRIRTRGRGERARHVTRTRDVSHRKHRVLTCNVAAGRRRRRRRCAWPCCSAATPRRCLHSMCSQHASRATARFCDGFGCECPAFSSHRITRFTGRVPDRFPQPHASLHAAPRLTHRGASPRYVTPRRSVASMHPRSAASHGCIRASLIWKALLPPAASPPLLLLLLLVVVTEAVPAVAAARPRPTSPPLRATVTRG